MPLNKDNPQGRGHLAFFANDPYFNEGSAFIGKAVGALSTAVHAGTMFPLGVGYDATRRLVAAPVQLVGFAASFLPSKEDKVEVVDSVPADAVKVESEEKAPKKVDSKKTPAKKAPVKKAPKVVNDLKDLGDLIPGASPA